MLLKMANRPSLLVLLTLLSWVGLAGAVRASKAAGTENRRDILIADFEGTDYGSWKATGEAFGTGPAQGTLPKQMPVTGFKGKGLVNSYLGGDRSTGTLTSPPFTVDRKYIQFLMGGGKFPGKTCMNLLLDGRVVRTATGPNDQPGGSEHLDPQQWDVTELAGKTAILQILDDATGGWGHITVDHIVQTDRAIAVPLTEVRRTILAQKRYLNLPVKTGAPKRRLSVLVEGRTAREFEIELADNKPDFWTFLDLEPFRGQEIVLMVDRLPEGSSGLESIAQSDVITGSENLYREELRPQLHFTSRRGWLNDPNGLVYARGQYHLYYQHNPYGWDWGNMHWGHAVSKDLVHWQELPIALYPRQFGDWCFSGSTVVDRDNTSGFRTGDAEVLVAAYTSTGRGECILYSNDQGRTWSEYAGNPVIKHAGRDPRLLWYALAKQWVMAVYDEHSGKRWIAFYTSPDLKQWTYQSQIEGFFECPDLFELPVDGGAAKMKWVLTAASSDYRVGTFDGKKFIPETPMLKGHRGRGFYAAQTFSDIPAPDGRRIQIGWLKAATPGMSFNHAMSVPLELELRQTPDGPRLAWAPVRELVALRESCTKVGPLALAPGAANPLAKASGELLDVVAVLEPGKAREVALHVRGIPFIYDVPRQELLVNGHRTSAPLHSGVLDLRILVDRTAVEVFASRGLAYIPLPVVPKADNRSISVAVEGGPVRFHSLEVHSLKAIWPTYTREEAARTGAPAN